MLLKRSGALVVCLVLAATTAACGSRLPGEERALGISSGGRIAPGDGGSTGDDLALGDPGATTTTALATSSGSTGARGDSGTGGGGGARPAPGPAGACTPSSATSQGVTPAEIKVGNVSQMTGLVPRFAQTSVNGVRAYFNMVNARGGVCGRKLTLVTADDRFQAATNRAETEKLAGQVIALVGSLSVVDDGGAPIVDQAGIADISLATTGPRMAAQNNFSPNPIDPTPGAGNGLHGILEHFERTDGISKAAILYQDVATGVNQTESYKVDFQRAGIPVVATYPVSPTATNFNTQANDMKAKGIDFVITVAEVNAMANLARAFESVGYYPKVPFYGAQVYGKKFLQLAGSAAEGTRVGLIFAIPEEAGSNPAMAEFVEWYARTAPGADIDFFALAAWVAADMFVSALEASGPDPTKDTILAEMRKVASFDGGGLVANINPAQKKNTSCFHVVAVRGGAWTKEHPAQGFQC